MLKPSWIDSLQERLSRLGERPRLALVGIGHELRGDDAAGLLVVRELRQRLPPALQREHLLIEAAHAPENQTGPIRRFAPDLVLLVDAAHLGRPPGAVAWLAWEETTGLSASTHTMPPAMLAGYLVALLSCDIALIGIQPADTSLGAPLSPAVREAVEAVAAGLARILCPVPLPI